MGVAPTVIHSNIKNMALKKGICKNYDNCTLADNEEIQEVEASEFKCRECRKDLHELNGKPGGKRGNKKLLLIVAAVVVLIGGGVGAYFAFAGGGDEEKPANTVTTDTTAVETDTIAAEKPAPVEKTEKTAPASEPAKAAKTESRTSQQSSTNLGWGTYSGPMQGGQPNGIGGTIKVTSSHSIDLKDGRGTMLEVQPGETIENTKFENGRLRSGELHRNDGTRKYFNC